MRSITMLFFSLLLAACTDEVSDAKKIVERSVGHKKPEFTKLLPFPGGVVCGEYLLNTSDFSTTVDREIFIIVRGKLYKSPGPQQWNFFCSNAPAEALLSRTGIGPFDADNSELARITDDLTILTAAVESYYLDHDRYPTMTQGLAALVTPPDNLASIGRYPKNGYLKKIPVDPWGRAYLYQEDQWGRTRGSFAIRTLGADGVEGGAGNNADVSSADLLYLQHMAVLAELR